MSDGGIADTVAGPASRLVRGATTTAPACRVIIAAAVLGILPRTGETLLARCAGPIQRPRHRIHDPQIWRSSAFLFSEAIRASMPLLRNSAANSERRVATSLIALSR